MAEKLTEKLTGKEKTGLVLAFVVVIAVSATAGFMGAEQIDSPIELDEAEGELGDELTAEEVEGQVKELITAEMEQQQMQIEMMAAEDEEMDADDFHIDGEVTGIADSQFESLYEVTVSITGEMPSMQDMGETDTIDEEDLLYISKDGRYIFMPPQDLEDPMMGGQEPVPEEGGDIEMEIPEE